MSAAIITLSFCIINGKIIAKVTSALIVTSQYMDTRLTFVVSIVQLIVVTSLFVAEVTRTGLKIHLIHIAVLGCFSPFLVVQ